MLPQPARPSSLLRQWYITACVSIALQAIEDIVNWKACDAGKNWGLGLHPPDRGTSVPRPLSVIAPPKAVSGRSVRSPIGPVWHVRSAFPTAVRETWIRPEEEAVAGEGEALAQGADLHIAGDAEAGQLAVLEGIEQGAAGIPGEVDSVPVRDHASSCTKMRSPPLFRARPWSTA